MTAYKFAINFDGTHTLLVFPGFQLVFDTVCH